MPKTAIILINYKDYASRYLKDCIESLREQKYDGESRFFVVDNETSTESFAYLKTHAPEAEIIRNEHNDGFAKGNNDAMKRALRADCDYIILFNMDVVVEQNCVAELVRVAKTDRKIGAVQARLMLWPEKEKINSLGNATHFLGFGYSLGYRQKFDEKNLQITDIAYPSGAAVLFTKEALQKAGLFDEEFWMYNEDQDIGWRLWLCGLRCVMAPEAVVWHKYEFSKSIQKYYWMDRNRVIAILKNYHWLTLLLILPAFAVMEIGLILLSLKTGWFGEKTRVWRYFLTPRTWAYILKARRQTQRLRAVPDTEIVKLFSGRVWYQEIDDVKLRLVNPVFDFYWRIIKYIILC